MSLFDAVGFVKKNAGRFGGLLCPAEDFAVLLATPEMAPDFSSSESFGPSPVETRLEVFWDFRDLCRQAGFSDDELPLPEIGTLERAASTELSESARPKVERSVLGIRRIVLPCNDMPRESREEALDVVTVIERFPFILDDGGSLSRSQVMARLNLVFCREGRQPVEPPWRKTLRITAGGEAAPARSLSALIVDDDIEEALRTFRALLGWPLVSVRVLIAPVYSREDAEVLRARLADSVLSSGADIVIMDQGMAVPGHELIREVMRRADGGTAPIFVGNTGGSPDKLSAAGAIGNMEKGRDLSPMRQAVSLIE